MQVTTDYTGRQVDIEYLQTVVKPTGVIPVSMSFTASEPKMITGLQKLIQRYVITLLTSLGDVFTDPGWGTDFLHKIMRGAGRYAGYITTTFAFANVDAINKLREDERNTDLYGPIPDDERIAGAYLTGFEADPASASISLSINISNLAGATTVYVVPVAIPGARND